MTNPKRAIDVILMDDCPGDKTTVKPLTIARYALLERIESPILTGL